MLMKDRQWKQLNRLENKYGNIMNVPEDDKTLQSLRNHVLKGHERPKGNKVYLPKNQNKYKLKLVSKIIDLRCKGMLMEDIADKLGISISGASVICRWYGVKAKRTFYANLINEKKTLASASIDGLTRQIKKFKGYKHITASKVTTLNYSGKTSPDGLRVYCKTVFDRPTFDQMKEIAFKMKTSQGITITPEQAREFLNEINGKDVFTYEETVKWTS